MLYKRKKYHLCTLSFKAFHLKIVAYFWTSNVNSWPYIDQLTLRCFKLIPSDLVFSSTANQYVFFGIVAVLYVCTVNLELNRFKKTTTEKLILTQKYISTKGRLFVFLRQCWDNSCTVMRCTFTRCIGTLGVTKYFRFKHEGHITLTW